MRLFFLVLVFVVAVGAQSELGPDDPIYHDLVECPIPELGAEPGPCWTRDFGEVKDPDDY